MSFLPLYLTNLWGVMNDNVLKILVCFVASLWVPEEYRTVVVNATAGILVLPYVLFSPLAGGLPSHYGKVRILRVAKIAEFPIMAVAIAGFVFHSVWLVLLSVLLMGLQSALFSPSKYGLIKDIGGPDGVSEGMGGMEAISFLGMLAGSVAASFLAELAGLEVVWFAVLLGLAALGWGSSLLVKAKEAKEMSDSSAHVITFLVETTRLVNSYRGLGYVIHYLSLFWWMSASLQTVLIIHCAQTLAITPSQTGMLLALMAIGISVGCVVSGKIDRKYNLIGLSPLMGLILMLLLVLTFVFHDNLPVFAVLITLVAFAGGMFKIPLDAEIQKRVSLKELSVVLAYFNQVSFFYIFLASATNILITLYLPSRYVFLFAAIVMGLSSLFFIFSYRKAVCQVGLIFMRSHYDISEEGRDALMTSEGQNLLVLPAHRAVLDPLMLFAILHDVRIQPLCDEGYFRIPVIGRVLSLFDAIEVPDLRKSRRGVEKVLGLKDVISTSLAKGDNVLFYPAGHITTDGGESIGTRQLAHEASLTLPDATRVVAIRINGLWGSQWSRYGLKATPSIVRLLLKSAALIFTGAIFFMRRRRIVISYHDITAQVREWSSLPRVEFNKHLEEFYSADWPDGIEPRS